MTRLDHTETVTDAAHVYVIAYDRKAGARNRYTVHVIDRRGDQLARILGRELPLRDARAAVKRHGGAIP